MLNFKQIFSFNQLLPLIGIILCLGVLIVFGGFYLYKQKSLGSQPESKPIAPKTTRTSLPIPPTPTLASGQKAIYTFYIQATSHKSNDEELTLSKTDTGKIHTADIGALIIVNFGRVGKFHVSASSPQAIFTNSGRPETIHLPNNALGAFRVYRPGWGTLTVIENE